MKLLKLLLILALLVAFGANVVVVMSAAAEWLLAAPLLGDTYRSVLGDHAQLKLTAALTVLCPVLLVACIGKATSRVTRRKTRQ